jgi:hypothetical protein
LLCFLVLRWRGFRVSNGITLAFRELRCDSKEVERLTRKRKKRAVLPLHPELFLALDQKRIETVVLRRFGG